MPCENKINNFFIVMACKCKRKAEIEEKYGEPIEKTLNDKIGDFCLKIFGFVFVLLLTFVLTPLILFVGVYKMFFSKNKTIVLPKFISKRYS